MSNIIKIKRRPYTNTSTVPPILVAGELAYNEVDAKLYYGQFNGDSVQPTLIAGSGYFFDILSNYALSNGSNATGTWAINITGTSVNINGGAKYSIPYQDAPNSTKFLPIASSGTFLRSAGPDNLFTWSALTADMIPSLPASKINTGTFEVGRIPSLPASTINTGTFEVGRIPSLPASTINTGTFEVGRIPSLHADKIASGIFSVNRLGSGTPTANTFLRGDGQWNAVTSANDGKLTLAAAGNGISLSADPFFTANQSTDKNITITLNSNSDNVANSLVLRDSNGFFSTSGINATGINVSGIPVRNVTSNFISTKTIGGIIPGESFNTNDEITKILRKLLGSDEIFLPVLHGTIGASRTNTFGGQFFTGVVEIGATGSITSAVNSFNRGEIRGGFSSPGVWNTSSSFYSQGFQVGPATGYQHSWNNSNAIVPNNIATRFYTDPTLSTFTAGELNIYYSGGTVVPTGSDGQFVNPLNGINFPRLPGFVNAGSAPVINVARRYFVACTTGSPLPTTATGLRALIGVNSTATISVPTSNFLGDGLGTINVSGIPAHPDVSIIVAFPSSFNRNISAVDVKALSADITSAYNANSVQIASVPGLNNASPINYTMWAFKAPFEEAGGHHRITVT